MESDTIFALASGAPPAAISILRISGTRAFDALEQLSGGLPEPRRAALMTLRTGAEILDQALVLRFPGPRSFTGDDLVELHLHGGRAVVAGVTDALKTMTELREAEPGEFTRRAFANGRIDLAEAEGLADLLAAETASQRRAALGLAGGALSRLVEDWSRRTALLAAMVEAQLDFSDEGDVDAGLPREWGEKVDVLAEEVLALLAHPSAERLRDGVRVVIAGPPNSGKSSLLNALVGREAAITSTVAGTTRDLLEAPIAIAGVPIVLVDSAGLRESGDLIEQIGVERAEAAVASADMVLWLGPASDAPARADVIVVQSKIDIETPSEQAALHVSARTGEGLADLGRFLADRCRVALPTEGEVAINARHRAALVEFHAHLLEARHQHDLLILAEHLRLSALALGRVTGRSGVEDMLDALFGRFCIGK